MTLNDHRTYEIIKCAYDVHNELGMGFPEKIYQEAMTYELNKHAIPYVKEAKLDIVYKDQILEQRYFADFICFDTVIVELKALKTLEKVHVHQVINYLKASDLNIGLLLNFGAKSVQVKRVYL